MKETNEILLLLRLSSKTGLAPVLVIILGILDFVKALAAQDDDAMKKAQGKFVKRLIAAVVLFLLPLIIDYVLSVFNLVDDTCSINTIF